MVSELVDDHTRTWNTDRVQEAFVPMDAELVLNIPLPTRQQDDWWAWHYEKRGVFTVRSAYRMLVDAKERRTAWLEENAGKSDTKGEEKDWTSLWNVRVPSKLRVFLRRLAKQTLPSMDLLHHRHMAPSDSCRLCGAQDSWRHALLECNMSRSVWALLPDVMVEVVVNIQEPDARGWLAAAIEALSHEEFTLTAVSLWAIWYARRKAVYEEVFQSPLSTLSFINRFCVDLEVQRAADKPEKGAGPAAPRWFPPPPGVAKINVDVALSKNSKRAALSAIARNDA
jgi:hypothetical protein